MIRNTLRITPLAAVMLFLPGMTWAHGHAPVWSDTLVQLHGGGKAFLVDSKTDAVIASLDTCKGGTLGSMTPDAKKVYVSCAGEGQKEVVVIDMAGKSIAKRIETGSRPKHGLVSPNGKLVGVDHWGLTDGKLRIAFLDAATDQVVKSIDLDVVGKPAGVTSMHNAWSQDSRRFFSMDRVDNRLVVVDVKDFSVKTLAVPSAPHYPVPSPNGKELWLIHEGNETVKPGVIVYDLGKADMPVIAQMEMPLIGEEVVEAHHGNFTQDGKLFMALNRGPGARPGAPTARAGRICADTAQTAQPKRARLTWTAWRP